MAARSRRAGLACRLATVVSLLVLAVVPAGAAVQWTTLAPGMELGTAHSTITIVRIDPKLWDLEVLAISRTGDKSGRSARQWSHENDLAVAINAGMFATDYRTHVGYLRIDDHVDNGRFNKYQSVVAFNPKKAGLAPYRIFDLDAPGTSKAAILRDYGTVVQNLRLIKRPGENRWSQQKRKWSEAALGEDGSGRILFIYSRTPFSMYDLNRELLALGVDLVAAQHLDGGPEPQLYVNVGDVELEYHGPFATSFKNGGKSRARPLPFVLGARPKATTKSP